MSKVQWLVLPMLLLSAASPLPPQVVQVTETTTAMAWSRPTPTPSSRSFATLLRTTMTLSSKWRMKGCSNGSESLRMEILPALKPYSASFARCRPQACGATAVFALSKQPGTCGYRMTLREPCSEMGYCQYCLFLSRRRDRFQRWTPKP